jgi:hypothetical protein
MEELFKMTLLLRGRGYLTDRYSERKERPAAKAVEI